MTYAQRFKAKVAEVMPDDSPLFEAAISDDEDKRGVLKEAHMEGPSCFGMAYAICAVIDHEESQNP